jgi:hypothetical protein
MRSSVAINSSYKLSLVGPNPPAQPPLKVSGVKGDVLYGETKNEESYLRKKIKPVLSFDKRNEGTPGSREVSKLSKHVPRLSFCFLFHPFVGPHLD